MQHSVCCLRRHYCSWCQSLSRFAVSYQSCWGWVSKQGEFPSHQGLTGFSPLGWSSCVLAENKFHIPVDFWSKNKQWFKIIDSGYYWNHVLWRNINSSAIYRLNKQRKGTGYQEVEGMVAWPEGATVHSGSWWLRRIGVTSQKIVILAKHDESKKCKKSWEHVRRSEGVAVAAGYEREAAFSPGAGLWVLGALWGKRW